jgi:signal transduction histidine kinase
MAPADRPQAPSSRFLARLRQLFRRSSAVQPHETKDGVLSDLAVAQFVHDLRNHLTVIHGYAEVIFQAVPRGQKEQDIAAFRRCVEQASLQTRELLKAARPRFVSRGRVDLNHVVALAMVTLSPVLGDKIRVRLRLSAEPVTVVAEALELERIFLNLVLTPATP